MLKINNLEVATDNKIILKDFNLIINDGEIHTIMGPNGVGKSTLSRVIMGDPNYKVLNGEMTFNGDNLMVLSTDERATREGYDQFISHLLMKELKRVFFLVCSILWKLKE